MDIRNSARILLVTSALAASACSSSSTTPDPGATSGGVDSGGGGNGRPSNDSGAGAVDAGGNTAVDARAPVDSASPVDAGSTADADDSGGETYDFGCGGNTGCPISDVCCTTPGPPTSFSCVLPAACTASNKIACDGPDECGGATPVCCGVAVGNGTGTFPQCNVASLSATCTSAAGCVTHLGNCSETSKTQICHVSADCTEAANPKCCTFTNKGVGVTFCTDATTATLGAAVCH